MCSPAPGLFGNSVMCPCVFSGSDCLPTGRAERPGEPEEGFGEEDQDAGVRSEAGTV